MPKLLVVDKSVFHTFYDYDEKLCEFVKKYNAVLPHTLAIECVISENKSDKEPDKLCIRLGNAIKAGARGGKLLGAGGGGFILFFVDPEKQQKVREKMKNLLYVPFKFEKLGSQIIYYAQGEE